MTADGEKTCHTLADIQQTLEQEDRANISRARLGAIVRGVMLVLMVGYMTWLSGSMDRLSAVELTRFAAAHLESKLPEFRAELRDYAIEQAPAITDHAQAMLLSMPETLRKDLQVRLQKAADAKFAQIEMDIDMAITAVLDQQLELVRSELPQGTPEDQLEAFILGISDMFRETMIAALDEIYEGHSGEITRLTAYLERLQRADDLSDSEKLDKELLEVWMLLVHKHGITDPYEISRNIDAQR